MATTTNYGWTTPDNTDLVKDGALAIRTLGSAVDTTVFANAGASIAKTIVDAKGDIIAATAADTVARLAVGANDTVLTADSTAATGLKWAAPVTPSAGGLVLISRSAVSGAGTHSFNNVFTSTYESYKIVIQSTTAASTGDLFMRLRASGTDTTSSYVDQRVYGQAGNLGAQQSTAGTTAWFIGYLDSGASNYYAQSMDIYNPQLATVTTATYQNVFINGGNIFMHAMSAWHPSTTQFDGFTIRVNSGNIAATVSIYGYAK